MYTRSDGSSGSTAHNVVALGKLIETQSFLYAYGRANAQICWKMEAQRMCDSIRAEHGREAVEITVREGLRRNEYPDLESRVVAVVDTRPPACVIMMLDINEIRMQAILYVAESGIPPWVEQDISRAYLELSFCFSIHPMPPPSGVWAPDYTEWCVARERSTTAFIDDKVVLLQEKCLEHARKHFWRSLAQRDAPED